MNKPQRTPVPPTNRPSFRQAVGDVQRREMPSFVLVLLSLVILLVFQLTQLDPSNSVLGAQVLAVSVIAILLGNQIRAYLAKARPPRHGKSKEAATFERFIPIGLTIAVLLTPGLLMTVLAFPLSERWQPVGCVCLAIACLATTCSSNPDRFQSTAVPVVICLIVGLLWTGTRVGLLLTVMLITTWAVSTTLLRLRYRQLFLGVASRLNERRTQKRLHDRLARQSAQNRQKAILIAGGFHDIQQPVQAINILARQVFDGGVNRPEEAQLLIEASHRLSDLTQALMLDHQLEISGYQPKKTWTNIGSLFEAVTAAHQAQARTQSVSLNIKGIDFDVLTQPIAVQRTLQNLVRNALEHANASEIHMTARFISDGIAIGVRDNGIGLEPAQLESFRQLTESPAAANTGSVDGNRSALGLGLSIAVQLSERSGFELKLGPNDLGGTQFILAFPDWRSPNRPGSAHQSRSSLPADGTAVTRTN